MRRPSTSTTAIGGLQGCQQAGEAGRASRCCIDAVEQRHGTHLGQRNGKRRSIVPTSVHSSAAAYSPAMRRDATRLILASPWNPKRRLRW